MNEREDPDALADELEQQAGQMQEQGERLQDHIDDTRSDWESKRSDPSVPGAVPTEEPSPDDDDPASFPAKDEEPD